MSTLIDEQFMRLAIDQARIGRKTPGGAEVGAVLVRDSKVVYTGFNEGEIRHDPTAHAEIVVIRGACAELQRTALEGYTLYCTLQPCGMCTIACLWAGISRIVYGAGRHDVHPVYFESRHLNAVDFIRDAFRDDLQVEEEVLAVECAALYASKEDNLPLAIDPAHRPTKNPS
jgi:tRNA(adenine34) deaminase